MTYYYRIRYVTPLEKGDRPHHRRYSSPKSEERRVWYNQKLYETANLAWAAAYVGMSNYYRELEVVGVEVHVSTLVPDTKAPDADYTREQVHTAREQGKMT